MVEAKELAVRDKKELVTKEEKTVPGRYYIAYADIFETEDALSVVMEMPGVEKENLTVALENDTLRVEGRIDFAKYDGMEPIYTEYNIGHYTRSFALSNRIDREKISAQLADGVLTLALPKAKHAQPRASRSGSRRVTWNERPPSGGLLRAAYSHAYASMNAASSVPVI